MSLAFAHWASVLVCFVFRVLFRNAEVDGGHQWEVCDTGVFEHGVFLKFSWGAESVLLAIRQLNLSLWTSIKIERSNINVDHLLCGSLILIRAREILVSPLTGHKMIFLVI